MTVSAPAAAFDLTQAPIRVGRVFLHVRDGARVAGFYERVLGLRRLAETPERIALGVDGGALLELRVDPARTPGPGGAPGLFHTAFLLPSRGDLGRWLAHAEDQGVKLQGSADHRVSEAIYLSDPEGNGIEVYADRPPAAWDMTAGRVAMPNHPLDVAGLRAAAGNRSWQGAPSGTTVGHLHLQVPDTAEAERVYAEALGFDVTFRLAQASFFGAGGYHHQLAANSWRSAGAGPRPAGATGLAGFELVVPDPGRREAMARGSDIAGLSVESGETTVTLHDPWGLAVTIRSD